MNSDGSASSRSRHLPGGPGIARGFSLVEMLAVIAVIGIIAATTAPMLFSTMKANRLTSAGEEITNRISLAQQLAVSGNQEVELRFYHYMDPEEPQSGDHYRATIITRPAPDPDAPGAVTTTVLSDISYLRGGIVVAQDSTLSPLLAQLGEASQARSNNPDTENRIPGTQAGYRSLRFFPDGTCDVPIRPSEAYLTIVDERDVSSQGTVPKNFFAVQVDRYTSRVTIHRP